MTNSGRMLGKVLIANRGEIAVRVIRTCRDLGIETVLAFSEADRDSLGAKLADQAVCIGPPQSRSSYLNIDAIITAALVSGAEAIHPGYGFLAENPAFARACVENNLQLIGPSSQAMELMGNKMVARATAQAAGVPVVPGSPSSVADPAAAMRIAEEIGYPLMLKAAAGGGGRGMRRINGPAEMAEALTSAAGEAQAAFGDGSMYMEKFIGNARHIEIQLMGDRHGNVLHLGERDCTLQRRYQKVVEEAPSPAITPEIRERMGTAAVALARHVHYEGAGTVEFIFDQDTNQFYFMEMNTRLQVEHPVTEAVTGLDLVALQLVAAAGLPLPLTQRDVQLKGHAIEFRINAENPDRDFMPSAGRLVEWLPPLGPGVRVDSHCYPGYMVPPYYDSLIAKVIVHGESREHALARSRRVLRELVVSGVDTTLPFHQRVLNAPDFISGRIHTQWIAQWLAAQEAQNGKKG